METGSLVLLLTQTIFLSTTSIPFTTGNDVAFACLIFVPGLFMFAWLLYGRFASRYQKGLSLLVDFMLIVARAALTEIYAPSKPTAPTVETAPAGDNWVETFVHRFSSAYRPPQAQTSP